MATILPVEGVHPQMGNNCFVAPNATIVGDVIMGDDCSVWFNTVIRGDVNSIRIGNKVNIQDGAVIHCTYEKTKTIIGNNVSIGHNAIVHGCKVHDNVLIGMGAIVMDNAEIGSNSIIAAGAVVLGRHKGRGWCNLCRLTCSKDQRRSGRSYKRSDRPDCQQLCALCKLV